MRVRSIVVFLSVAVGPAAAAQVVHTRTEPSGTPAAVAPAGAVPGAANPSHFPERGQYRRGYAPVVVLADGRVFADFGRGYEQVVNACGSSFSGAALSGAAPVMLTAPRAPGQPQVVQPVVAQPPPARSANGGACWAADGRGQIVIARP